jgi:hypothetical protein
MQNIFDKSLSFPDPIAAQPLVRSLRAGAALEFAAGGPVGFPAAGYAVRGLISVERDNFRQEMVTDGLGSALRWDSHRWVFGSELALFGIATGRVGYVGDADFGFHRWSYGLGIGGELRRGLGIQFDYARVPVGSDGHAPRYSVTVRPDL